VVFFVCPVLAGTNQGGKPCSFMVGVVDGHDAPFAPVRYDKSPARLAPHNRAGRGAYAIRALRDCCHGIGSERLGGWLIFPSDHWMTHLEPRL